MRRASRAKKTNEAVELYRREGIIPARVSRVLLKRLSKTELKELANTFELWSRNLDMRGTAVSRKRNLSRLARVRSVQRDRGFIPPREETIHQ